MQHYFVILGGYLGTGALLTLGVGSSLVQAALICGSVLCVFTTMFAIGYIGQIGRRSREAEAANTGSGPGDEAAPAGRLSNVRGDEHPTTVWPPADFLH